MKKGKEEGVEGCIWENMVVREGDTKGGEGKEGKGVLSDEYRQGGR